MITEKICQTIEQKLLNISDTKLKRIFNNMFPEELLGSIDNEEFKEEVIQSIMENISDDETAIRILYKKLFNEKISIETENYFDEEEY